MLVGTLLKNKLDISMLLAIPVELQNLPIKTVKCWFHSTQKKKIKSSRSSMHHKGTISDESSKPDTVEFYNITQGAVDMLDKLCNDKTIKGKTEGGHQ